MGEHHRYQVLMVEDEPINRKVLEHMLDNMHCDYDVADVGVTAVKLALSKPYDIILLDIQLPDVNGITITEQLRNAGLNVPIIATTAHTFLDEKLSFIAAGMNDVLAKPFRQQQLATMMDKWLKPVA